MGGHDVPAETIVYNFNEGIKLVKTHLSLFDEISFVDTEMWEILVASYIRRSNKLHVFYSKEKHWFNGHFKPTLEKLIRDRSTTK